MLDPKALAQLSALRTQIEASKVYAEGLVAATAGRFGFVRMDDGRDAFLAPEKMDRVLPGDRVKILVVENDKGKLEGNLEKLLASDFKSFVGQYKVKGNAHFVSPSGGTFNRWIFIPPNARKECREGEMVRAEITRHPYQDGRAQAKITHRIGKPEDPFIELRYVKAKYEIERPQSKDEIDQLHPLENLFRSGQFGDRPSLDAHPFVTIDSESTLDMDDALCAEWGDDESCTLRVAIADPGSFIAADSPLGRRSQSLAQSVYLLGETLGMLPATLAHDCLSLVEGEIRPSLLCNMQIDKDGSIGSFNFSLATLRSQRKMNYGEVAEFLTGGDTSDWPEQIKDNLRALRKVAELRREFRAREHLVSEDQSDFDYVLDDRGKIAEIRECPRNAAQQIVEEAMIATNICAGEELAKIGAGLFTTHPGFREDRLGEVLALLKEENIESESPNELPSHLALMKQLDGDEDKRKLIPALRRMMRGGELSARVAPHLAMGLQQYATVTSPIRRFADLYNHWVLLAHLGGTAQPQKLDDAQLTALNDAIQKGRQADRELLQWLLCIYAEKLLGTEAEGRIRIVTPQGFGVRLLENGIEGFVLFGREVEKSFDAKRLTLTIGEQVYRAEQSVKIKIGAVDLDKRRIAFDLV